MGFFGGGGSAASNMVGATSSAAGTAGLVPAPAAGDENKQLLGSANFVHTSPYNITGRTSSMFAFHTINTMYGYSANNVSLDANKIYFSPIFVNYSFTFDRIIFANRSGNAQTNIKFGLYRHERSEGVPKNLIVESSNVASIAGTTTAETTVTSTTLSPDVYWICFVSDLGPFTRRCEDFGTARREAQFLIGGSDSANLAGWAGDQFAGQSQLTYALTYTGTQSLPTSLTTSSIVLSRAAYTPFMAIRKS